MRTHLNGIQPEMNYDPNEGPASRKEYGIEERSSFESRKGKTSKRGGKLYKEGGRMRASQMSNLGFVYIFP